MPLENVSPFNPHRYMVQGGSAEKMWTTVKKRTNVKKDCGGVELGAAETGWMVVEAMVGMQAFATVSMKDLKIRLGLIQTDETDPIFSKKWRDVTSA